MKFPEPLHTDNLTPPDLLELFEALGFPSPRFLTKLAFRLKPGKRSDVPKEKWRPILNDLNEQFLLFNLLSKERIDPTFFKRFKLLKSFRRSGDFFATNHKVFLFSGPHCFLFRIRSDHKFFQDEKERPLQFVVLEWSDILRIEEFWEMPRFVNEKWLNLIDWFRTCKKFDL